MNFLKLVKKKEKKFDFKIVIALLVLAILLFLVRFLAPQSNVYARDFLPQDTTFYFQWTNQKVLLQNEADNTRFFDTSVPQEHLETLQGILGKDFSNLKEVIWFRTESAQDVNHYLVRFSSLPGKFLDSLQNSNPDYFYFQPSRDILLISESDALGQSLPELIVKRFTVNYIDQGLNIYWFPGSKPEFLSSWDNLLPEQLLARDIFINLQTTKGHVRLNLYQTRLEGGSHKPHPLSGARLLADFDLMAGFQASSTEFATNFISRDIILQLYNALPYYNLNQEEINNYILSDSILIQDGAGWLLVGKDDWQGLAIDLAHDFELQEVSKLLPDGTTYIELLAGEEQPVLEHEFSQLKYWQIDGLYGISLDNMYYLSNEAFLLEGIINNNRPLSSVFGDCLSDSSYEIGDFISLEVDQVPASSLRDYLETKNIGTLDIFSYQNSTVEGLQLCF
ncbi:hypothetical protein HOB10_01445 [Candidatus Parcubacteria bacterium]|nr:hypothetical protein [Candidatus Parcubacteria bacterium]